MTYCIVNGDLLNISTASIGINDLALQRGYGIFDYLKVLNGIPVFLDDHLDRFYNSADSMRLEVNYSREEIRTMVFTLLEKNAMQDSGVKLLLTGGYSPDGFNMGTPNLIITHGSLPSYTSFQSKGIKIITYKHQRQMPAIKTIDYLMAVWLQTILKEESAQDVLYHDGNYITECPRSNIFIVTRDGRILTPETNVLHGVIRKQLLKLSPGFPVSAAQISLEELYAATEIFLTSTTKNILPVCQVNDRVVGKGEPGPVTLRLSAELNSLIRDVRERVH